MKTIDYKTAVKLIEEGGSLSKKERMRLQNQRLHELVEYVRLNSPYFKELYRDLPENFTLEDLPITTKKAMQDNYSEWLTNPDLNKDVVRKYLDRDISDNSLLLDKCTALQTSGSTGEPLMMVRDDYHNKIHGALVNHRLMRGLDPNILNPSKYKIATVIHTSPGASSYNGYLRALAAFPDYVQNMLAISVLEDIDTIVKKLNDFQPDVVTGYASSLILLAKEKKEGRLNINPKLIANSAELLSDKGYFELEDAFRCKVINNYCMTEGGEVAMANGGPEMKLNEDWVIVEPVDKNLLPVKDRTKFSDGILITDLSNFVQPIIRYYVGDRVKIVEPQDHTSLPELKIDGRTHPFFTLAGKKYTMVFILTKAEVWPGLMKIQVVQISPDTLEIRGVCFPGENPNEVLDGLSKQLEKYFHDNGCKGAHVTYSLQPLLHNKKGGKIPEYVNLMNQD
ncbi:MAG: phenylacetate--CoA ligase family protein [Muribaculaceae bacterium]|nr:phenylacetate--CoA ligase family protein [Muribaculaceae bacterium]